MLHAPHLNSAATRSFLLTLLGILGLYLGIFLLLNSHKETAIERLAERLPVKTLPVTMPEIAADILSPEELPAGRAMLGADRRLLQVTEAGALPQRDDQTGRTPFGAYSKKVTGISARQKAYALVIQDFGLNTSLIEKIFSTLPESVTLMQSAYAVNGNDLTRAARAAGFEVWLSLPMTRHNSEENNGPLAVDLTNDLSLARDNLYRSLATSSAYPGVLIDNRDVMPSNAVYGVLTKDLYQRGLGILTTVKDPYLTQPAIRSGAAAGRISLSIDNPEAKAFEYQLSRYLKQSREPSVISLPPYASLLHALPDIVDRLAQHGYVLQPVSAIIAPEQKDSDG